MPRQIVKVLQLSETSRSWEHKGRPGCGTALLREMKRASFGEASLRQRACCAIEEGWYNLCGVRRQVDDKLDSQGERGLLKTYYSYY